MDTRRRPVEDDEGATHGRDAADRGRPGSDSGLETTNGPQIDLFQEADGERDGPGWRRGRDGDLCDLDRRQWRGDGCAVRFAGAPDFPDSYDEAVNLAGLLNAVVTVTDGDGDVATGTVGIGDAISFEDDGPSAAIALTGTVVMLDKSVGGCGSG